MAEDESTMLKAKDVGLPEYFDMQAELGHTKHIGGWFSTQELAELCHLGAGQELLYVGAGSGTAATKIALEYDFAFFEYWITDMIGHRQDMSVACSTLELFDQVLEGLLPIWLDQSGLILITSDHGNLEDLSTRRHTRNDVLALLIGTAEVRRAFGTNLSSLVDIAPRIEEFFVQHGLSSR